MKRIRTTPILATLLAALLGGCASQPYQPQVLPLRNETSIEITYLLGHHERRFVAASKGDLASAQTFAERSVLEFGAVDHDKYETFYKRALDFIHTGRTGQRTVANTVTCRSPYTVIVRNGPDTWSENGCRSTDEGGFGRLIRDGEFLLYSKK
jgi:hypothetical protein